MGLLLVRLEGQAIAEFWALPDQLGMFKQLGDAHHEPELSTTGLTDGPPMVYITFNH